MTYDNPVSHPGWTVYRVGQGILIVDGQVLLSGNRWYSKKPLVWTLPGGRAEDGEGLADTVVREFREETGLTVAVGELAYVCEARSVARRQLFLTCAFAVTRVAGELGVGNDPGVEEVRFVAVDDLQPLLGSPSIGEPLMWHLAHPDERPRYWFYPEYASS